MSKQKYVGGSQASSQVVKLVSPAAFDNLNTMFKNQVSLSGGNCRKNVLANIDLNEVSNSKMTVFNRQGGQKPKKKVVAAKKTTVKKTSTLVSPKKGKVPTKKPVKVHMKKGGADLAPVSDSTAAPASAFESALQGLASYTSGQFSSSIPPANIASRATHLNMSAIPESQQLLATQEISTMSPINKVTAFPDVSGYKGASFAFGGAKKCKVPKKVVSKGKKKV